MTEEIVVDTASPTPPFEQIRAQFAGLIRRGALESGEHLPPVRQLASDLGLAVGTVARAYRELVRGGYVVARRGGGTLVAAVPPKGDGDRPRTLADHAEAYVAAARRLGATDSELVAAVRAAVVSTVG